MAIHRKDRSRLSSEIFNEGAHSEKLSWAAKGLLWFLLTEPSDLETGEARELNPEGFDTALQELRRASYAFECDDNRNYRLEVFESERDGREWFIDNIELLTRHLKSNRGES